MVLTRSEVSALQADELLSALREQIGLVGRFLSRDKTVEHYTGVWLPDALACKYPNAPFELGWHYLFSASRLSVDPGSGGLCLHYFDENNLNKVVKKAARDTGIRKTETPFSPAIFPRTPRSA